MGYHRAGFDVVGIDVDPQPDYPFEFIQGDALHFIDPMHPLSWQTYFKDYDAIHASPPCQRYSEGGRRYPEKQAQYPDLIAPTRDLLLRTGLPYVIENVIGARRELHDPVKICGRSVGLPRLARHRLFETNWTLLVPACVCSSFKPGSTIGVYGDRPDGRQLNSRYPGARAAKGLAQAQEVMEMDWTNWHGTKEAIPPRYTELIGLQLMQHLQAVAA